MPEVDVFLSYSRRDAEVVAPVVQMIRATDSRVFLDRDSIRPGRKWREEIDRAIDACQQVMLMWCCHSSRSEEVEREYLRGIDQGKSITPILWDDTELAAPLRDYQWIDFRRTVGEHETEEREVLSAAEVRRIQKADREGEGRDFLGDVDFDPPSPGAPSSKGDESDQDRVYYSDGNLYRDGWEPSRDGGVYRIKKKVRRPSQAEVGEMVALMRARLDSVE